ncbi:MAG: sugar phosphate isomerase/epimerase [Thaumarchaeota archaeon]|nr:sugar phosphate isomerase/epimerase [Nitrososphaerota archaeon]
MAIKLSACTLGYTRQTTVEEAVRRIASAGYKGVDLYTGAPHAWPQDYLKKERDGLKKLISDLGLKLTGFAVSGGGLGLQYNFSSPRESIRKATLQYYIDNIKLADELGCPLMNVLTGHVMYGTSKEQGRKWTMDALHEIVAEAEKTKFILGLHPQYIAESSLMITVDDALEMIKELNSSCVKIIYDTAQQNISYRNFMDDIRRAGKHLCYVHGADNDGVRWTHEALGNGTVDWEGIVRALVEINFDGYICTQSWSELPNDVDSVMRSSREYLEQVFKKVGVSS